MRKTINILDIFLAFIVAFGMVFASNYYETGAAHVSMSQVSLALLVTVVLLTIFYYVQTWMSEGNTKTKRYSKIGIYWHKFWHGILSHRHFILVSTIVIFLCWLIPLIFLYPGNVANDGWGQIAQFQQTFAGGHIHQNIMSDHHPFFDTLVMGLIITPFGNAGHWHIGFFVYVLIQAALTSCAFAWTVWFSQRRLHLSETIQRRLIITYCFWPIFATTAASISKDTLFSWIYVLFIVIYSDIVLTRGKDLSSKAILWSLPIVGIGCILTKKLGIYVIALSLIGLCLVIKKHRKRLISLSLATIIIAEVILHIGTSVLGTVPGGMQEMFSVPFQQTARTVKEHPNSLKGHDRKVVNTVLPVKGIAKRYNPTNADPVKGYNDRGNVSEYLAYLQVWAKMGLKYPKSYIAATNAMLAGWFSLYEYRPLLDMNNHTQLLPQVTIDHHAADRHGWSLRSTNFVGHLYDDLYNFPLFTILLSYSFYTAILPFFVTSLLLKSRRKTDWLLLLPMVLSIVLGCWLSPVSAQTTEGMRYLCPVVYTLPLMLVITRYIWTSQRNSQ